MSHKPAPSSQPAGKPSKPSSRLVLVALALILVGSLTASAAGLAGFAQACLAFRWVALAGAFLLGVQKRSLTAWIIVAMLWGAEIGYDWPEVGTSLQLLSNIFLKMIKTVVAPLLFATLVVGIAGHANLREVGRMGLKTIIYFEIITTLALVIGLAAINITHAGVGVPQVVAEGAETLQRVAPQTASEVILHAFPENIARSVSENQVLQIVVFSVLFGIALAQVPAERRKPMLDVAESLAEVMFKYTNLVMLFAPIGVGGAVAYTIGKMGTAILVNLAWLVGTLYLALAVFILAVLVPVTFLFRIDLRRFVKAVAAPVTLAFATTSSEAALPRAMEQMEEFGVPRHIVAFVMPTGYSFNLDGTTLYLALAAVFVAQATNVYLSWEQQVMMLLTLMLTSKGVAGVPRASLVILLGTASSFGLAEWPILAIMGVDALMDMARTATNVLGNCLASAVVARWEGQLGTGRTQQDAGVELEEDLAVV